MPTKNEACTGRQMLATTLGPAECFSACLRHPPCTGVQLSLGGCELYHEIIQQMNFRNGTDCHLMQAKDLLGV